MTQSNGLAAVQCPLWPGSDLIHQPSLHGVREGSGQCSDRRNAQCAARHQYTFNYMQRLMYMLHHRHHQQQQYAVLR